MRDCCICGCWCRARDMHKLLNPIRRVDRKLFKFFNTTLLSKHLCNRCKRQCTNCKAIVPRIQAETAAGLCAECGPAGSVGLKKKK